MESTTKKTWKPIVAGVLNVVTGALSAISAIAIIIALIAFDLATFLIDVIPAEDLAFVLPLVNTILIGVLILSILHTVFPIIGGIYALQRKRWGWVLAGSIVAVMATLPFGIISTVLIAIAKEEFE